MFDDEGEADSKTINVNAKKRVREFTAFCVEPSSCCSLSKKQKFDCQQNESQFLPEKVSTEKGSKRSQQPTDLEMPQNVGFYIKDGIRYLNPYWTSYKAWAKGRWVGRKMVDVFRQEFLSLHHSYAKVACKLGRITVNGKQMTDPNYVFRNNDAVVHTGHRHEHPVLARPMEVIADTDDFLVVNKPHGIPVHPCGQYRLHTVLGMIATECSITNLRVLHRLDRTTSGVLILAKSYESDIKFKLALNSREIRKEYVCKVDGVFPGSGEEVVCNEPIGVLVKAMGIQCVREDGKKAKSRFRLLWTDGKISVVKCFIDTGRTHQIRVHLQYLGFPIVGDELYNCDSWGPFKGKEAKYGKSYEELCKDISDAHRSSIWHETVDPAYEKRMENMADNEVEVERNDLKLEERPEYDPICLGCNVIKRVPSVSHFMLYLHCLKYETANWSYSTELPEWAVEPCTNKVEQQIKNC